MRAELIYIKADRLFGFVIRYTHFERAAAPMQREFVGRAWLIRAPNASALADLTAVKGTELVE
jgi:hypothetical protein